MPRKLSILAATLLLVAAAAAAGGDRARVEWRDERLSVSADDVALEQVLVQVAELTGMWMDLRGGFPEPVRVSIAGLPLREAVVEILSAVPAASYAIVDFQDPETGAMTIALSVARSGAAAITPPPDPASGAGLETVPRRYRPGTRQPSAPDSSSGTRPPPAATSTDSGDPVPAGDAPSPAAADSKRP